MFACWDLAPTASNPSVLFLSEGSEIPASTVMDTLLTKGFKLVINELAYDVRCHKKGKPRPSIHLNFCFSGRSYREQSNLGFALRTVSGDVTEWPFSSFQSRRAISPDFYHGNWAELSKMEACYLNPLGCEITRVSQKAPPTSFQAQPGKPHFSAPLLSTGSRGFPCHLRLPVSY